jgi:hypothetical protein
LKPAWANSWRDPISKITREEVVEHLLWKSEAQSSNTSALHPYHNHQEKEKSNSNTTRKNKNLFL